MGKDNYDRQDAESFKGHMLIAGFLFAICIVLAVLESGNTPNIPSLPQACQDINTCNTN